MSANNVVWIMKHISINGIYHVFYSGCIDNTPTVPDYKNKWYKAFDFKDVALAYAYDVVERIDEFSLQEGHVGVEYGVCEVPIEEGIEERLSNIDLHINTLNKESIETNIIVKKTLESWLEKNVERILKEYIRKFNLSLYMKMKFNKLEEKVTAVEHNHDIRIKRLEEQLIFKENRIKERLCELEDKGKPPESQEEGWYTVKCGKTVWRHPVRNDWGFVAYIDRPAPFPDKKPPKRKDGCYQFTYCNECLAYPMGFGCPNITKGPVQLKKLDTKPSEMDCDKCYLYSECDHQGFYIKEGKWCYE